VRACVRVWLGCDILVVCQHFCAGLRNPAHVEDMLISHQRYMVRERELMSTSPSSVFSLLLLFWLEDGVDLKFVVVLHSSIGWIDLLTGRAGVPEHVAATRVPAADVIEDLLSRLFSKNDTNY
jgi:hypothetical protein